jgi:hypothetical protein
VDILPTVAGLANIPYRNHTLGRDLLWQQQQDGGASNAAFIIDRHDKWIGLVKRQHFGRQRLDGTLPEVVWADFSAPAGSAPPRDDHATQARAFYETSRYLLLHNKKPAAAGGNR